MGEQRADVDEGEDERMLGNPVRTRETTAEGGAVPEGSQMGGKVPAAAGVVLAGGRSARIGTSKAALEWHGSTLLRRVSGILLRSVEGPVVVVRAPGQPLPPLPRGVELCDDAQEGLGPLQGLAEGLRAVADRAEVAFVASTDLPFLHVAFVRAVLRALLDADRVEMALPHVGGFPQPLAAAYRTDLAERIVRLLSGGKRALAALAEHCAVTRLPDSALLADPRLAALDPHLHSVVNVNRPRDYAAARSRPAPEVAVGRAGDPARRLVRAATLGHATEAAAVALAGHVALVGGDHLSRDPELPLVPGDTVELRRLTRPLRSGG